MNTLEEEMVWLFADISFLRVILKGDGMQKKKKKKRGSFATSFDYYAIDIYIVH